MRAYIDSSVVLRVAIGATDALPEWSMIDDYVASDAIHLASAMAWRDHNRQDLAFATHDDKLARAARAAGFQVLGA